MIVQTTQEIQKKIVERWNLVNIFPTPQRIKNKMRINSKWETLKIHNNDRLYSEKKTHTHTQRWNTALWNKYLYSGNLFCHIIYSLKSVRIGSFPGPYLVRMWENTNQKNSKYWHFSFLTHWNTQILRHQNGV